MTFSTLVLLVAAGLAGPLLATMPRLGAPLVVGEIAAGVLIGRSGLDLFPVDDPALTLLSDLGFALLMLIVGTHLPLRRRDLRPALRRAVPAVVLTAVLAAGGGLALAPLTGLHRPALLAVLLAASSAAVALPVLQSLPDAGPDVLVTTAWVALVDVATVLAVPLVVPQGGLRSVLAGIVGVGVLAAAVPLVARWVGGRAWPARLRDRSRTGHWALDLRGCLLILFALAAVATRQHTSVLVAGFAAGAALARIGEPRRLAEQLIGLGEGFLVPIFFVTLGARLQLGALVQQPRNLVLAAALAAGAVGVHVAVAVALRLPVGAGLLATAQLGVPAAVASLGLTTGLLGPGEAAAVLAASLLSLVACSVGARLLGHRDRIGDRTAANGVVAR